MPITFRIRVFVYGSVLFALQLCCVICLFVWWTWRTVSPGIYVSHICTYCIVCFICNVATSPTPTIGSVSFDVDWLQSILLWLSSSCCRSLWFDLFRHELTGCIVWYCYNLLRLAWDNVLWCWLKQKLVFSRLFKLVPVFVRNDSRFVRVSHQHFPTANVSSRTEYVSFLPRLVSCWYARLTTMSVWNATSYFHYRKLSPYNAKLLCSSAVFASLLCCCD